MKSKNSQISFLNVLTFWEGSSDENITFGVETMSLSNLGAEILQFLNFLPQGNAWDDACVVNGACQYCSVNCISIEMNQAFRKNKQRYSVPLNKPYKCDFWFKMAEF